MALIAALKYVEKNSVNGQSANYIYLRGSFSDLQAKPLSPSTYLTVLQSFGYF